MYVCWTCTEAYVRGSGGVQGNGAKPPKVVEWAKWAENLQLFLN